MSREVRKAMLDNVASCLFQSYVNFIKLPIISLTTIQFLHQLGFNPVIGSINSRRNWHWRGKRAINGRFLYLIKKHRLKDEHPTVPLHATYSSDNRKLTDINSAFICSDCNRIVWRHNYLKVQFFRIKFNIFMKLLFSLGWLMR